MKKITAWQKQKIRRFVLIVSALLFPITMIYLSPGMVFRGARLGILSGSYIIFMLLFLSAIFVGRLWCAWLCPAGGLCDVMQAVNANGYTTPRLKRVKYVIWVVWLAAITGVVIFVGKGFSSVDFFLGTYKGISIHSIALMVVCYGVVGFILINALFLGKRGFCHTFCWMAPFMVLGRKLGNRLNVKAWRLSVNGDASCSNCKQCENTCPMSLPIAQMLGEGHTEHMDCILCGECAATCPNQKLSMRWISLKKTS